MEERKRGAARKREEEEEENEEEEEEEEGRGIRAGGLSASTASITRSSIGRELRSVAE